MTLQTTRWLSLLIGFVGIWISGCAALSSPAKVSTSPHPVISAKQARAEQTLKSLPEMTIRDYEAAGDRYARQGDAARAVLQYDRALLLAPDDLSLRYKKGSLLLSKGKAKEAISNFGIVIKQDPSHTLAYEGIGKAYFQISDLKEAQKHCLKATKLNTKQWGGYNCLGRIYDRQERFQEAVTAYRHAIQLQPQRGMLWNNLGLSYYAQGKYKDSTQAFNQALTLDSKKSKIYNNLGIALSQLERYDEAFEMFTKGGSRAQAYNNLGVVYLAKGQYRKAVASFEKALTAHPNFYEVASHNLNQARRALETSHQTNPAPPKAFSANQ